jgi:CHAD domain-containing protein
MKARKVRKLDPVKSLRRNSALIVKTRLEELCSFAEEALDPSAPAAQHSMRIAAKRLRYVLEIVEGCFGEEALAARRAAKELQSVLGEIHDCDVMGPHGEGVESLGALLRTRRELLHRRFRDLWQAEETKGTWVALERSLH